MNTTHPTAYEIDVTRRALTKYAKKELNQTIDEFLGEEPTDDAIKKKLLDNDGELLRDLHFHKARNHANILPFDKV